MNRKIGVLVSYLLITFEMAFALLFTPYIIRVLGSAEYGVYKLVESLTSYLLLLDMGVGQAVVRWMAKYRSTGEKEKEQQFLGFTTLFYAGVGGLTYLIGLVLVLCLPVFFSVGLTENEIVLAQRLLHITAINAAVTLGTVGYANTIVAHERFLVSKGLSIVQILFRVVFYYIALGMGMGSYGIVCTQTLLSVLGRTVCILYVFVSLGIRPIFREFDKGEITEITKYASLIFILMISTQVNAVADNVILAAFVPESSVMVGIYSVGLQLANYFVSITYGINGVLMPGVVQLVEQGALGNRLTDEMIRIGRWVFSFSALLWGGFFICGKTFVALWVGNQYLQAYAIAFSLITVHMLMQIQYIGDNMLKARNEIKELTAMRVGIIFVNIGISLLLIRWNAIWGTLIGTVASLIIGGVVIKNFLFVKHLHINFKRYLDEINRGILICVLILLVIGNVTENIFEKTWNSFLWQVAFLICVYVVLLWVIGFNQNEKDYLKNMFVCSSRKGKKVL